MTIFLKSIIGVVIVYLFMHFKHIQIQKKYKIILYGSILFHGGLLYFYFIYLDVYVNANGYMLFLFWNIMFIQCVYDLFFQKILLYPILVTLPIVIIYYVLRMPYIGFLESVGLLFSVLVGGVAYKFLSKVIGEGDILMTIMLVVWLGIKDGLGVFFIGCVINGLVCIVLWAWKKVERKTPIPFMPAVAIGFLIAVFSGGFL